MQPDAKSKQDQPGMAPLSVLSALPKIQSLNAAYWMSPNQPILPTAPKAQNVTPRQWDYPVGVNLQYLPRTEQQAGGAVFPILRALADSYDVLRNGIEEKKNKILNMEWNIRMRDKDAAPDEARIKRLTQLVQCPDGRQSFLTWMRAWLEDMIVIDAAVVEPRFNVLNQLVALDYLAGDTFKIVIDELGRRPQPPDPAFQQIIKGQVAANFTNDELLYYMRNPRTNKLYGMSYVEQILVILNIALRHEARLMAEFTESNVPAAFMVMPEEATLDEIKAFSGWLDAKLAGNIATRSKIIPIPGGGGGQGNKVIPMKQYDLKNPIMEWFARVVCHCLQIDPTPYLSQHTKATAEQSGDSSNEIGLTADLNVVQDFWNTIFSKYCDSPDIVFAWRTESVVDVEKQSVADKNDVMSGVGQIDEIRQRRGLAPLGLPSGIVTAQGYVLLPTQENQPALDAQAAQAAAAKQPASGQDGDDPKAKADDSDPLAKVADILDELVKGEKKKS